MTAPKAIALYLPQYHPIPENDAWWEPGFTEWTNVTKARPLYRGHKQPYLPSELGFYDLRLPEARAAQAALARDYGVHGFCYYHYWFGNGKRLLERPFEEVLASGEPDFPFMLCWANQTWSGVWHGLDKRILAEQTYPGPDDERRHFDTLLAAFRDTRYIRVDGKPVFMLYAPQDMPDVRGFTERWRQFAHDAGLEGLYLLAQHADPHWDCVAHGFDAFVLQPYFSRRRPWVSWRQPVKKLWNRLQDARGIPCLHRYDEMQAHLLPEDGHPLAIPCVLPNWDNTPRSGPRGVVMEGCSPVAFGSALDRALSMCDKRQRPDNLLFIKSWNEWAEGNHLEPSREFGRGYLETLKARLKNG